MVKYFQHITTEAPFTKLILKFVLVSIFSISSVAYAATQTFNYTGAIEYWIVPADVTTITVEAWGAQGGDSTYSTLRAGGLGAYVKGDISVTPGSQLKVLVGGQGESLSVGGGGGGSFIATIGDTPLIVAGGGGGASSDQNGVGGAITEEGTFDSQNLIAGGTGGNGGNVCSVNDNDGGGGGGFYTDGANANSGGTTNGGFGGISFVNGGAIVPGGRLDNACIGDSAGGFGGGGSTSCNTVGGGGGGGYSGGAGGPHLSNCAANSRSGGGGGGSFNSGTNQTNTPVTNIGNGSILITYEPTYIAGQIPTLSQWGMILMSVMLAGSALWMIRRRQIT